MDHWESLVDKKIREAMEQGEFDDLQGKGEPIDLSENPFEDPDLRLAHRTLRNAGFAPAWIEERKDIDSEFELAKNELSRVWTILQNAGGTEHERGAEARWKKALSSFERQVSDLNRRITAWNLKLPTPAFYRKLIDTEREIGKVQSAK